jgi:PTS system nitrogen regulatory IIA component
LRKLLKKPLARENIFLDLAGHSKSEVISEILDGLADAGVIRDKAAALTAVMERERKMSTGLKHGVALPHGKTDSVDKLVAAVGIKRQGVEFDCADGCPAQIFIMTISPSSRTGPHIQFLAEVSKILRRSDLRERLLAARSPEDVIELFS